MSSLLVKFGIPVVVGLLALLGIVTWFAKYQYDERVTIEHNYQIQEQFHQETLDSISQAVPILIAAEREDERSTIEKKALEKALGVTEAKNVKSKEQYEKVKTLNYIFTSVTN